MEVYLKTYSDRTIHNVFWSGNNYAPAAAASYCGCLPGEVPWNDEEKARMQALNDKDVSIDYAFMVTVEKFMRHGVEKRAGLHDLRLARRFYRCGRYSLLLFCGRSALRRAA